MSTLYKLVNGFDSFSGAAFGGGGGGGGRGDQSRRAAAVKSANAARARAATAARVQAAQKASAQAAVQSNQKWEAQSNQKTNDNSISKVQALCAGSTAVQAASLYVGLHPVTPPPARVIAAGALAISTVTQAISCGFAVGQSGGKYSPPNGAGPL